MTLKDLILDSKEYRKNNGIKWTAKKIFFDSALGGMRRLTERVDYGSSLFDLDWDMLIILDACRPDLMREVSGEYNFIDNIETFMSNSSTSSEWMDKNFTKRMDDVCYVTSNPFSQEHVDETKLGEIYEVWKNQWNDELGIVEPRSVTDMGISCDRNQDYDRMILHYMQPHIPFLGSSDLNTIEFDVNMWGELDADDIWNLLEENRTDIDRQEVWKSYRKNLEVVLDEVEIILSNTNRENVIISADHGNAFGEWMKYGHGDMPIPAARRVPLVRTSSSDKETHEPEIEKIEVNSTVEERLESLGYK